VARLRQHGDTAPVYDDGKEEFSVEVHHGGFFVGHGYLRSYVSGKVSWFDHVETDTWSPLWLDQFVEDLGYLRTGNLKIYWLLPGKEISGSQMLPHLSSTQLSQMMQEEPQPSLLSQQRGPLPDPDFIMTNRPIARSAPLTTGTKQGKAAATKKRKVAKNTEVAASKKNTAAKNTGAASSKKKTAAKSGTT